MTEPGLLPPLVDATAPSVNPNYQRLAEYWAHGEGAAKIRWGVPGDFNRCVRQLTEEAGADLTPEQIKGLCNHLHQRALGVPPGQEHPKAADGGAQGTVDGGTALVTLPGVDLVAAGTWSLSTGPTTFTPEDFRAAIDAAACPAVGPPLIKLGHVDPRFDGEPAVGRVTNMRLDARAPVLKGDLTGMPGWLGEAMPSAFPRRSIEGAYDFRCQTGHRHPFVITGLALLGVTPPGVGVLGGLDDVQALYEARAAAQAARTWTLDIGGPGMNDPHAAQGTLTEDAVREAYYAANGADNYSLWIAEAHLEDPEPSLIVADSDSRKTYRVPVSLASGSVTFGDPVEVRPAYVDASFAGDGTYQVTDASWQVVAAWDGGAAVKAMGDSPSASAIRAMFAIPGATKSDSKLPHHDCSGGTVGAANPTACSAAIAAINGAHGGLVGVSPAEKKAAYGHLAAHLRAAGREPPPLGGTSAAAADHPYTGTHTHEHPAMGEQGGDEMHEHAHAHAGDGLHDHQHDARAGALGPDHDPVTGEHAHWHPSGARGKDHEHMHRHRGESPAAHDHQHADVAGAQGKARDVDLTEETLAGLRTQLGIEDEGDLTGEALLDAVTEMRKRADAKAHASYKPPEGVIVVAREAWEGLQARVKQGELAREAQLRGERDQVLDAAIRDGKFSASRRPFWERLWTSDPEGTRAAIGTLARNAVPMEDIGSPGSPGGFDELLDDEYRALFPPVSGS